MSAFATPVSLRPAPVHPAYMTTEADDVELARRWREDRKRWSERETVSDFEQAFGSWNGSRHVAAFDSGRMALRAALEALELEPGAEVIVPGYTCVVVPNAVRAARLTPVFADIELDSYGLDPAAVERVLSSATRAIVVQHLYGLVSLHFESLLALARRNDLRVIEDCAQAMGAIWRGDRVGTVGDIGIYSTERSKVISTGEGGLAVTEDARLGARLARAAEDAAAPSEDRVRRILDVVPLLHRQGHARGPLRGSPLARARRAARIYPTTTVEEEQGDGPEFPPSRMSAPAAALGMNQLRKIESFNTRRRAAAERWDDWCVLTGHRRPVVAPGSTPIFLRYPVLVDPERKRWRDWAVRELGVELGVWFTGKLHPRDPDIPDLPHADTAVARCVNLPTLLPDPG
ncbi:MAG TPA: DegT/DnrJ/EryC1/StrS family aminotransferase [Longimicrobiales bacterium]|nr:DegT/DnrJ/EryC1/StrS family aminotransferase [Longimicrobiales bacterium]